MLRNRRNRENVISESLAVEYQHTPPMGTLSGAYWVVVLRSTIYNLLFYTILPFLLVLNTPVLLLKKRPFYVAEMTSTLALWMAKVICGLDYKIIGEENIPEGACIFACKHQSAWDTIVFLSLFPSSVYVLKHELTKIPVYGAYIRKFGMISIDRSRGIKAIGDLKTQAASILEERRKIVIFPEGSRTTPGKTVPYQKGISVLYKDIDCPILPVALNSGMFWARRSWLKWPGTITLQFLEPINKGLKNDEFMHTLQARIEGASDQLLNPLRDNHV